MKIIFFGPPGSGKGTQAQFLNKKFGIPQISAGDILRHNIKKKNKIYDKIKKCMNEGKLVNDKIIINLIKKRINKKDCILGFILDGFPRTLKQAQEIKKNNILIDYIIEFNISEKIIYERILGRRIHLSSGRTYHIKYHPPKIPEKDDITQEKLIIRKDDKIEIIKKRLLEYQEVKNNIIKYYKKQIIKNKDIKYYKIDASKKEIEINKKLINILKYKKNK